MSHHTCDVDLALYTVILLEILCILIQFSRNVQYVIGFLKSTYENHVSEQEIRRIWEIFEI